MQIIALVGADGMGKTTQVRALVDRLANAGHRATAVRPVFLLFDPWRIRKDAAGVRSLSPRRKRLRGRTAPLASFLGYPYALLTYAYMRLFLRGHEFVVCDRYFYQYFYDLAGRGAVGMARAFPRAHRTLWLDADMQTLLERIDRPPEDDTERRYFKEVFDFYRRIAAELGFVRVDVAGDARSVGERIWSVLMPEAGPRAG